MFKHRLVCMNALSVQTIHAEGVQWANKTSGGNAGDRENSHHHIVIQHESDEQYCSFLSKWVQDVLNHGSLSTTTGLTKSHGSKCPAPI